ncbi:tetratricopeptide repeat protein [Ktedonospora formicarum]|uniref:WDR19 first beta-propeller domain-containing protein n=1 Tax=Ktedonospora formicarum TaxID=2778364 RepID=A0A8J3MRF7_9CHLR|nr:tetratricopeptide repeat protein [Ktedonospora formicarum]GHO45987.1 hypothetical protein KSX_41500 [Ktedonospora formicarum]
MTGEFVLPEDLDLNEIFIGRERQLNDFRFYLERWKRSINLSSVSPLTMPPAPNNKIQSFFVFLYGRGGFGKSTLLRHYREIALEYENELQVGEIVDWEFAAQNRRALFNVTDRENIDAYQYYNLLYKRIASALGKQRREFSNFRKAQQAATGARKQAYEVLDQLQQDESFAWLRGLGLARDALLTLLSVATSTNSLEGLSILFSNELVREKTGEFIESGARIGKEQWERLRKHLEERIEDDLSGYLDAPLQLGLALGKDLAHLSKQHPILIFFDTYEEIDEGDKLLQICIGAAGNRVGWILSGRDNLWSGLTQRRRWLDPEYGYRELVHPDLSVVVDFSADGVGDFALSDIEEYFNILCQKTNTPWPTRDAQKNATRILNVTQGVPLAVKIAASLYLEKPDMELITKGIDSRREIVEQMVERYLIHTRSNPSDRTRLYGLALLRRIEEPDTESSLLAAALNVSQGLETELSRLHRRYGFIFTKHGQPALHQEVRHFLRLWLLQNRARSEVMDVIKRLRSVITKQLQDREKQYTYSNLRQRMGDHKWRQLYLDYAELELWFNPTEGVKSLLPFMYAASIYQRETNREASQLGRFFENAMSEPTRSYWDWADQCLVFSHSLQPLRDEFTSLRQLVRLVSEKKVAFPTPLPAYSMELEAALWWRLAEAYQSSDIREAISWYRKARRRLPNEGELHKALEDAINGQNPLPTSPRTVSDFLQLGRELVLQNKPDTAIKYFNDALERDEESIQAYIERGTAYMQLREHKQALNDFEQALRLDPHNITTLRKRGEVYEVLNNLSGAVTDFEKVAKLDPGNKITEEKLRDLRRKKDELENFRKHEGTVSRQKSKRWLLIASVMFVVLCVIGAYFLVPPLLVPPQPQLLSAYNGHNDVVSGVAWSPNGKYIASGSYDRTVQIWDAQTRRLITTYHGHTELVWRVAWSPDSKYIASVGNDRTLQVWNAMNGNLLFVVKQENLAHGVAWSPDGTLVASSNLSGIIKVWNVNTQKQVYEIKSHLDGVHGLAWSHNGRYLAAANENNTVDIWNLATQTAIFSYTKKHRTSVYYVAWSKNDTYIASASSDNTLQVWNVSTGVNRFEPRKDYQDSVWGVAWSPDEKYIAAVSKDGSIHVYNAQNGNIVALYQGNKDNYMTSISWAPDSRRFVTGNFDGAAQVWQIR